MSAPASSDAVLAQFVQRAQQLYSLPAVALRVMELTQDPTVNVRELQRCVASDPALTGKLLKVVNSSLFGLSKSCGNLDQAITLLGIQRLKMLVLGFSLPMHNNSSIQPAVLERYWRHALIKSVAARELAESLWKLPGDEAFVAGLLQDLGLLVLVQDLGDSYVKFLHGVWSAGNDPRDMQTEVLGFDHVQLTARLLEHWKLPSPLLRAIGAPRGPQNLGQLDAKDRALPQILDLAELLTRFLLDRQVRWLDELLDAGDVYLGLKIEQLYSVLARVEKTTPELAAALSVPWSDETSYVALLEEAHRRQSETINQVASELLAPPRRPIEVLAATNSTPTSPPQIQLPVPDVRPISRPPSLTIPAPAATPRPAAATKSTPCTKVVAGSTSNLVGRLNTVVASCRQSRLPVSLLLVELDNFDSLAAKFGTQQISKFTQDLKLLIHKFIEANVSVFVEPISDSRLGAILTGADRQEAIRVARQVLDGVRKWTLPSLSIGLASLAMPPRNFPALELVQAAERCLNGVRLSGGNGMKSIELC
jgi:HD-like signal output (HDOD) protein/GGDEF domain-containing protein